jgi:hypothetical protein
VRQRDATLGRRVGISLAASSSAGSGVQSAALGYVGQFAASIGSAI